MAAKKKEAADLYNNFVRDDLIAMIPDLDGAILDVGCASGATMKRLIEKGASNVKGAEVSEVCVRDACANGLDVRQVDVDSLGLPFDEKSFDLVLYADVLEHLVDPWAALESIRPYLKPGGHVLISLPNISSYKILKRLIFFDRWDYADQGILDRTHLRFFTRRTARQMIRGAGLEIVKEASNCYRGGMLRVLNLLTGGGFTKFSAIQFLFLARLSEKDL